MFHIINYKIVFKLLSRNLFIISTSLLVCALVSIIYSEKITPFIYSSLTSFLLGSLLHLLTRDQGEGVEIKRKEAFFLVTLSWVFISLIGSLPYVFSDTIPSFTDALFESVSGFTTTGSSILTDIESLPKSILFWRSLTHWVGGIGIIVLFIIVMPSLHEGGYQLFTLESSFQEKMQPRIKSVGQRLAFIYVSLTILETLLLLAGGMNIFEKIGRASCRERV